MQGRPFEFLEGDLVQAFFSHLALSSSTKNFSLYLGFKLQVFFFCTLFFSSLKALECV